MVNIIIAKRKKDLNLDFYLKMFNKHILEFNKYNIKLIIFIICVFNRL